MYHFSMDGTDSIVLSTAHAPDPREFSCGESPRATLAELQDYSARVMASDSGYRFLVVDLVDIFDAVLLITGDASKPVDVAQDVSLYQVTSDDYPVSDDEPFTVSVGGFTWGRVTALVGMRVDHQGKCPDSIRSTAGAVREYVQDMLNDMGECDPNTEAGLGLWAQETLEAFNIDAYTGDATVVYASARDFDGVVLA